MDGYVRGTLVRMKKSHRRNLIAQVLETVEFSEQIRLSPRVDLPVRVSLRVWQFRGFGHGGIVLSGWEHRSVDIRRIQCRADRGAVAALQADGAFDAAYFDSPFDSSRGYVHGPNVWGPGPFETCGYCGAGPNRETWHIIGTCPKAEADEIEARDLHKTWLLVDSDRQLERELAEKQKLVEAEYSRRRSRERFIAMLNDPKARATDVERLAEEYRTQLMGQQRFGKTAAMVELAAQAKARGETVRFVGPDDE